MLLRHRTGGVRGRIPNGLDRRTVLGAAGLASLSLPLMGFAPRAGGPSDALDALLRDAPICRAGASGAASGTALRKLTLAWNATAICTSPVAVAQQQGILAKHGL